MPKHVFPGTFTPGITPQVHAIYWNFKSADDGSVPPPPPTPDSFLLDKFDELVTPDLFLLDTSGADELLLV